MCYTHSLIFDVWRKNDSFVAHLYNLTQDQELPLKLSPLQYLSGEIHKVNMADTNGISRE
jgi:hypothetical protein